MSFNKESKNKEKECAVTMITILAIIYIRFLFSLL